MFASQRGVQRLAVIVQYHLVALTVLVVIMTRTINKLLVYFDSQVTSGLAAMNEKYVETIVGHAMALPIRVLDVMMAIMYSRIVVNHAISFALHVKAVDKRIHVHPVSQGIHWKMAVIRSVSVPKGIWTI